MIRKCRILYVVGQLRAGGLERQLSYLLHTLDRQRYMPALVVWNADASDFYTAEIRALGIPLFLLPGGWSKLSKLRELRRMVKQAKPEIVHSYSFYTNFAVWYGTQGTKAVPVGSVRSDFKRAKTESGFILGRLCARRPESQIFNSWAAATEARASRWPFAPLNAFVVRNGVDLDYFKMTPLPKDRPVKIIGVGSLAPVKGWDCLLRVFGRLKQSGFDFVARIVGDGPLRGSLQQQAEKLKLEDHVEFVGESRNVPALLADALFLAHTSNSEGCPNAVIEAMACGRPVVATDVGDIPAIVDDQETGFVVSHGNEDGLAECMGTLIRNRLLCQRMSETARAKAERYFSLDRLVRDTLAAYWSAGWRDGANSVVTKEYTSRQSMYVRRMKIDG